MLNFKKRITCVLAMPLALSLVFAATVSAQDSAAESRVVQETRVAAGGAGATGAPKDRILNNIRDMLVAEASLGNTTANTPILAELDSLIARHSVTVSPKVRVTNFGPGQLRIEKPDGLIMNLDPYHATIAELIPGRTYLVAQGNNSLIKLEHTHNGMCHFWDGDDGFHTNINPGGAEHNATLTSGTRNYYLERK